MYHHHRREFCLFFPSPWGTSKPSDLDTFAFRWLQWNTQFYLTHLYSSRLFWFTYLNMYSWFTRACILHGLYSVGTLWGWHILSCAWSRLYGLRSGIYTINVAIYEIQVNQVSLYYYMCEPIVFSLFIFIFIFMELDVHQARYWIEYITMKGIWFSLLWLLLLFK